MPDRITGTYKAANLSTVHNNIKQYLSNQCLRVLLQIITIGNVHVIITVVSAKQVYNGEVKLFNKIKPFHLRVHFSHVP